MYRFLNCCFLATVIVWNIPSIAVAQTVSERHPPSPEDLSRRLRNRTEQFNELSVVYEGRQVYPKGTLTSDVRFASGEDEEVEGEWPKEDFFGDIRIKWRTRLEEQKSRMTVKKQIFNSSDRKFNPSYSDAFFDLSGPETFWNVQPRDRNPSQEFPIPENTPEYFEYFSPDRDFHHGGPLATALYASVGMIAPKGSNAFVDPGLQPDHISSIRKVGDGRWQFSVVSPSGKRDADVVCELYRDSARILEYTILSAGEPLIAIDLKYGENDFAEQIAVGVFSLGTVGTQTDVALNADESKKAVADEDIEFPGVPVGGVIASDGAYFYINEDGERVEFNPRIERDTSNTVPVSALLGGLGAVLVVTLVLVYRKSGLLRT